MAIYFIGRPTVRSNDLEVEPCDEVYSQTVPS